MPYIKSLVFLSAYLNSLLFAFSGRSVRSMYRKDLKSDILEKAKTYELKWSDFHEVL